MPILTSNNVLWATHLVYICANTFVSFLFILVIVRIQNLNLCFLSVKTRTQSIIGYVTFTFAFTASLLLALLRASYSIDEIRYNTSDIRRKKYEREKKMCCFYSFTLSPFLDYFIFVCISHVLPAAG